jgi:hypothetical protein
MEDEIFDIVTDLIRKDITKNEAIDKLLSLHNDSVSLKQGIAAAIETASKQVTKPKCVREGKVKRNER